MVTTMVPDNAHKDIPGNPSTAKSSKFQLRKTAMPDTLRVLTMEQWKFWQHNGYVVVKNAVPREQATATADFLWEFEEKQMDNPDTWYTAPRAEMQMKELAGTGMVEVYNNQYLWNNRQMQRVYDAFVDIWGTEKLWVTIDRANALNDQMDENMGGFQCIPWLYRNYDTWKLTQPKDRNRFQPDITGMEDKLIKVGLEAGDLLIFNSSTPHGIRPNHSKDKVRIAQYLSMMPTQEDNKTLTDWRVNSWRNRIAPEGYAFPGDPRNWEQTKYETATLNELGEKLLGLKKW